MHTPGPWKIYDRSEAALGIRGEDPQIGGAHIATVVMPDNARLIAAAPEMLTALQNVQKLISEAAMTGFNHKDGDWPQRLFESQQVTSRAIRSAILGRNST